ncbi:MAG: SPFH domain-containing protein [Lachnospiraceae bacterium]|nr:SPFH domain-containing protein [Lachnospiraceae bacterium]
MGIIRAAVQTVTGALGDQWEEVIEPDDMGGETVFTSGIPKKSGGGKGTKNVISNGSVIHVYDNQFMMLVDGGKIIDYTAEPGYYVVNNSSMPSMFNGQLEESLKEAFNRFKFGGATPMSQQVFYINLQEIKGIKFGTRNPINYFDNFYNAELFLRAHGTYSVKISNPLLFYKEAIPRNAQRVEIDDINEQYLAEFLDALQTSINQMSADGTRISYVASKSRELSKYMADTLDEDWKKLRGLEVLSVALASISYDEESTKLINMRNQGAMMGDPNVREGFVQSSIARGLEAAGSNANGSAAGFMGMGFGMQAGGNMMAGASAANMQQMQMNQEAAKAAAANGASKAPETGGWTCGCGAVNTGKFCAECGKAKPEEKGWTCSCGAVNTGKFCAECGKPRPADEKWTCSCGAVNTGKFCAECGKPRS